MSVAEEKQGSSQINREFTMTDGDFRTISKMAYKYTGIVLGDHKKDMVYGRLARRMRALGLQNMSDYCELIAEHEQEEVSQFINAITTNLTSFFRESHHFDFLGDRFCREMLARPAHDRRVRAWSAACSTGEEAYSIAITLREKLSSNTWDCKVLATDLDSKVLAQGRNGIYDKERVLGSHQDIRKWFLTDRNHPEIVKVKPSLQEVVRFKRLNLLEKWPMKGPFDFIFCRNVFIYFDLATQQQILNGFRNILRPGGYLFIGHSENLHDASRHFEPMGKTIYRRK